MRRPAILLFVVACHAVLLLLAFRWRAQLELYSAESLIFVPLPSHVPVPEETRPLQTTPRNSPSPPHDARLIVVPTEVQPVPPAAKPPAAVDWNAEAMITAKQRALSAAEPRPRALDQHGSGLDFNGGLSSDGDAKPEFGWYHARIHRVEALEGGGSILWLNDRCFIVMAGLVPFPMCGIGKIPARADLFDHMRD